MLAGIRLKSYQDIDPNERLQKQLNIIKSTAPVTEEQISLANKKIIALTQGLDPNTLDPVLSNAAAAARESEAARAVSTEKRSFDQSNKILNIMNEIDKQIKAQGLKVTLNETPIVDIEVRDSSLSATQRALGTRATGAATNNLQE